MKEIVIPRPYNDTLTAQLTTLCEILPHLQQSEQLLFDFNQISWMCPLFILPIAAYIKRTLSDFKIDNLSVKAYLRAITFPAGVDTLSAFETEYQQGKTYVPISVLRKQAGSDRERLGDLFIDMIYKIVALTSGAKNALHYPMAELVNNIFEHSMQDEGLVFGQLYQKKNYLDLCILDCGRGLAKTYREETGHNFSDSEAIRQAMLGRSTKKEGRTRMGSIDFEARSL